MGIKHYDIDGVADLLQLGKRGPFLKAETNIIALAPDGKSLSPISAAPGVELDELVTIEQLKELGATVLTQATEIAALQAMVAALMPVAPETYKVLPGMAEATLLGNLKPGSRVASISVEVKTAFDGGASLIIGDSSVQDFYMSGDHSDLQYPGTYTMTPPEGAPDSMITATLTGSPTAGEAVIRIEYA